MKEGTSNQDNNGGESGGEAARETPLFNKDCEEQGRRHARMIPRSLFLFVYLYNRTIVRQCGLVTLPAETRGCVVHSDNVLQSAGLDRSRLLAIQNASLVVLEWR